MNAHLESHPGAPALPRRASAFTLIELLIVISIMALLAALIFPAVGAVTKLKIRKRAAGELIQVQTAIEAYKAKFGYYPPDNPGNPATNQLYYELLGTSYNSQTYTVLDGSAQIGGTSGISFSGAFGPTTAITGFMNCTRAAGGDDTVRAQNFFRTGLKAGQFLAATAPITCSVLGSSLAGPVMYNDAGGRQINPWRYNSSSPTNNPGSFDLWIDVAVGSQTNRICNWSTVPLIVN
jgi:prepilin-type N-terminal cleavage/methylation domain-containing protein